MPSTFVKYPLILQIVLITRKSSFAKVKGTEMWLPITRAHLRQGILTSTENTLMRLGLLD
jgi:hypothetical protein